METGTAILLGVAAASAVLAPGAVWLWFRARRLQVECDSLRDEAEAATEIAAAVPDGFLLRDIETGRSRCSRRLAVLLELARGTEGSAEDVIACFEPGPADLLRRSLENLYESGQGFSLIVPVADDRRTIQAIGIRAFRATGRPAADIVWFRDLARKGNGGQAISGDGHFRALVDALPFPVWMQGAGGEVLFSNAAAQQGQADDTEILSVAVPETPLVFSYALPRTPRNPPQEDRSADWFRVLETVPTAVAVYGPDAHLRFANAAFVRLWRLDPGWLQSGPRFGDVLDRLRDARRLPEVPDYAAFRKQQVAQISSLSAPIESMMHLPDGTTLKRVMAPSPGGGVVFAYEDLSERLSLERSLNELNAVQRETLDNLFEGVAVFSADGHLRLSNPAFGAGHVLGLDAFPRIGLELLHAQRDALGFGVEADDLDVDRLADLQGLAGMVDAAPRDIGDVQQTIDTAEVDEGAVVGDVLDHALQNLAFLEVGHQFGPRLGPRFLEHGTARNDDVRAVPLHLEDLERLRGPHERRDVADRADIHLAARQEGDGTGKIDGEAALDPAEDDAVDPAAVLEGLLQFGPGFLAPRLFAAEAHDTVLVLITLDKDVDRVAGAEIRRLARRDELLDRHPSLGLQPDIDEHHVVLDTDHGTGDDRALEPLGAERLVEELGEILCGRGSRPIDLCVFSNHRNLIPFLFSYLYWPTGWFRRSSLTAIHRDCSAGPCPRALRPISDWIINATDRS